jgi:hypothetical protein
VLINQKWGIAMRKLWKKRSSDEDRDYHYIQALRKKKIPLLTLDPDWHELFPDYKKTKEIRQLEKQLNQLIRKQGQTNNDLKDYDHAKKVLMNNIVSNMTDGHESDTEQRSKKQVQNQRLMGDLNDKIDEAEKNQMELPREIRKANEELLVACMRESYDVLMKNTEEIEDLDRWIQHAREELKDKILQKQQREIQNTQMYGYMHKLLGPELVEVFDEDHHVWKGNVSKPSQPEDEDGEDEDE